MHGCDYYDQGDYHAQESYIAGSPHACVIITLGTEHKQENYMVIIAVWCGDYNSESREVGK